MEIKPDLRSIVHRNKPIYFLDECMFTVQSYQKREWSRVTENITVPAKQYNIPAYAFLGAIAMDKGCVHF